MGKLGFVVGIAAGAAVGVVAGIMMAPRSGSESRAMAADAVNDAWDNAVDTYEKGARVVGDKFGAVKPQVDGATDDLRAKVDLARERIEQLRGQVSSAVADASGQVSDAVVGATDAVADGVGAAEADATSPAEGVQVEEIASTNAAE